MTWQKLSKKQQDFARQLSARIPHTQCPQARRGPIEGEALKALCQITGWTYTAPERKATAKNLADELGVSLSTIYRRCRNGLLNAAKVAGRWIIAIPA